MSFFDDKQEILKVELTTYGRYLISRGKFKPAYYAFFDDEIIYDGEYAGLQEEQNSIQTRILEETLTIKPQTTYTSIENSVKLNTLLQSEIGKLKQEESQISADKNYALSYPLARTSHGSEYSPAWSLNFIDGEISGTVEQFINNSSSSYDIIQPFLKLPQINLKDLVYDIAKKLNDDSLDPNYDLIYIHTSGSDNYNYSLSESMIIIDLQELNVDDNNENFDIEFFIEEEQEIPGTDTKRKILNKLDFKKEDVEIMNNILLDEPLTYDGQQSVSQRLTSVEYYFHTTIDEEITLPPQQRANRVFLKSTNKGPFGDNC
jgi:hypothetical protein